MKIRKENNKKPSLLLTILTLMVCIILNLAYLKEHVV